MGTGLGVDVNDAAAPMADDVGLGVQAGRDDKGRGSRQGLVEGAGEISGASASDLGFVVQQPVDEQLDGRRGRR